MLEFENAFVIFEISVHLSHSPHWNLPSCKICEKMKMPKFGTQNALFGYFWARISKSYFYISNQHPRVCLIAKFREKNAKIWDQKCLIWVFSG